MLSIDTQRVAWVLGGAGLLPFVAGPVIVIGDIAPYTLYAQQGFLAYSAIILSFLGGTLWANAMHLGLNRHAAWTMILSNAFPLAAWASVVFVSYLSAIWMLLLGYPIVYWAERSVRSQETEDYRRMRMWLTTAVVLCHGLMLLYLNAL